MPAALSFVSGKVFASLGGGSGEREGGSVGPNEVYALIGTKECVLGAAANGQ